MKYLIAFILLNFLGYIDLYSQEDSFKYFGEPLPGTETKPFAQHIFGNNVSCIGFTPDGKEVYYVEDTPELPDYNVIKFMKVIEGKWSKPEIAPFSGVYRDWNIN